MGESEERHRQRVEAARAAEALASEARTQLSPDQVAHELNNPLSANIAGVNFARAKVRELLSHGASPELTEILGALDDAAAAGARVAEAVDALCSAAPPPPMALRTPMAQGTHSQTMRARARVLIIDDDVLAARGLMRMLRKHDVTTVHRGAEALELVEHETFDVVFCDLMMPDMTGMDVYDELVRRQPALAAKVTFITGGATTDRARAYAQQFATRLIRKPFDPARVDEAVRAGLQATARVVIAGAS